MKLRPRLRYLWYILGVCLLVGAIIAQQPAQQQPAQPPSPQPDPAAPHLTLDEKISLSTDDIKRQDILEHLQKQFQEEIKPITDHQEATKQVIEKEHPGWQLQPGPQGWVLVKRPEEKKAEKESPKPAAPAPPKK